MAFVEYFQDPFSLLKNSPDILKAKLLIDFPSVFSEEKPRKYIAACLLNHNLEPLNNDTITLQDLTYERLPAKFAISTNSEEFGWCRLSQCLVFVLVLPDNNETDDKQIIENFSANIQDFINIVEEDLGITLTAGVSTPFDSLDKCEITVRNALIIIDFACFIEMRVNIVDPIYYEEMKRFLERKNPGFRLNNYGRSIAAAILNQNYLHAELVLNKFLIAELCSFLDVFPAIRSAILSMCRVIVALSISHPGKAYAGTNWLTDSNEKIRISASLSELQLNIHNFFVMLQKHIRSDSSNATINEKSRRILDFINDNFKDPLFCASMVSDKFEITPSYLSRIFKDQVGVNLSTYVQTLRISAAMDLLASTDMTVDRIATAVGYLDGQNLQRVFKNYEGINPKEYRIMVRGIVEAQK